MTSPPKDGLPNHQPWVIIISPVGRIPQWINETIAGHIGPLFGMETRIHPLLGDIEFAHDPDRNQYHSTVILEALERAAPRDCLKVLAVTQEDLFIPILTHVYGEAQLGGLASIVSIARLLTDPAATPLDRGRARIIKEAAHELGHTFDLRHCEDPGCLMHYCRKIEDVDHKSDRLCRYCRVLFRDYLKLLDR